MRRVPKARLMRGLMKGNFFNSRDRASVELLNRKMADVKRWRKLNQFVHEKRGNRLIGRLKAWANWLWLHREEIAQILGIVLMFADDGSVTLVDADQVKPESKDDEPKDDEPKDDEPKDVTPDGEAVEDFVEDKPSIETVHGDKFDIGIFGDKARKTK